MPPSSLLSRLKDGKVSKKSYEAIPQKVAENEHGAHQKVGRGNILRVFRYASCLEILICILAVLAAISAGAIEPFVLMYAMGPIINAFTSDLAVKTCMEDFVETGNGIMNASEIVAVCLQRLGQPPCSSSGSCPPSVFEEVKGYAALYAVFGVILLAVGIFSISFWIWAVQCQLYRLKMALLRSILSQSAVWFDERKTGSTVSLLFEDMRKIDVGLTEKVPLTITWVSIFVFGIGYPMLSNWKLSLVAIGPVIPLVFAMAIVFRIIRWLALKESKAYDVASSLAYEVLSNLRTVVSFNKQEYESNRYEANLIDCKIYGIYRSLAVGCACGGVYIFVYITQAVCFWYGDILGEKPGTTFQVILSITMGARAIAQAAPNLGSFAEAAAACSRIFAVIGTFSSINNLEESGSKPIISGNIAFNNISFSYPTRPDVQVLKGVNLSASPGESVAIVGQSGSGKSTIGQLLLRLYDPDHGHVLIDGVSLKDINIGWLRKSIGVVSQEPVLFNDTIAANIKMGAGGEDVSQESIESAAKLAFAHDFIMNLPSKYDTLVGERGTQLSGGQKQRVAIARAIVAEPSVLLLDEATSALDSNSEALVQKALDRVSAGRTTIVIAHRLSTIKKADRIVVLDEGVIVESGTHNELIQLGGTYSELVNAQQQMAEEGSQQPENDNAIGNQNEIIAACDIFENNIVSLDQQSEDVEPKIATPGKSEVVEAGFGTVLKENSPELGFIILGALTSAVGSCLLTSASIFMPYYFVAMTRVNPEEKDAILRNTAAILVSLGCILIVIYATSFWSLGVSSQRLTARIRSKLFRVFVWQDLGWHDEGRHTPGVLLNILNSDAITVQGLSGLAIGVAATSISTVMFILFYGLFVCWPVTLATVGIIPLTVFVSIVSQQITGVDRGASETEKATALVTECVANMRTVMTLTAERKMLATLSETYTRAKQQGIRYGFIVAPPIQLFQVLVFFSSAICFTVGSYLVAEGKYDFINVVQVFTMITFSGRTIGRSASLMVDLEKAKSAAGRIFALINLKPKIYDPDSEYKRKEIDFIGKLEFKNLNFSYPSRPQQVLRNCSFTVESGQTVALVGSSGSGKSTIIQLLQHFYEADSGDILIDGEPMTSLDTAWLRNQQGLVSQEPVLFAASLRDNVNYGVSEAKDEFDVRQACIEANADKFITALPSGYKTILGERGALLSGGQKQRIALARALIRHPKLLLLDEATSALDAESERIVQEALDRAAAGRTAVVVAHRLSTIKNADKIVVLHRGEVVEQGTHSELMAAKGAYYDLQSKQFTA